MNITESGSYDILIVRHLQVRTDARVRLCTSSLLAGSGRVTPANLHCDSFTLRAHELLGVMMRCQNKVLAIICALYT